MERGPLPPHERTWLHPSELAAMESARVRSDPGGRTLRVAAMVSGTLGLVVVGVLAVLVTPPREGAPLAVRTGPSFVEPSVVAPVSTLLVGATGEVTTALAVSHPDPIRTTVAGLMTTVTTLPVALATPLESGMAIVTIRSLAGRSEGDAVSVRLPSGRTIDAEVVAMIGHAAVVAIDTLLSGEPAHSVADELPADDTIVTVMLETPRSVRLAELASLDAPEGTAVIDADGRLIGLCTEDEDGRTELVPAVDADEPPATAGEAETTVPVAVTTTAPSTTQAAGAGPAAPTSPAAPSTRPSTTGRPTSTTSSSSTSSTSTTTSAPVTTTTVVRSGGN